MDIYIKNLIKILEKKKEKKEIEYEVILSENCKVDYVKNLIFPDKVNSFFMNINYLNISMPRNFEIMPSISFELINERYLWFSTINKSKQICFDTKCLNSAKEWDIVNLENKFVITKTISSYMTNKIWAWVDRGRNIWDEEQYQN